jgi:hypothetical protein
MKTIDFVRISAFPRLAGEYVHDRGYAGSMDRFLRREWTSWNFLSNSIVSFL